MRSLRPILLVGFLASASPTWSLCGRPQPRLLCAEYAQSAAVVIAKLLSTREVPSGDPDHNLHRLALLKTVRGHVNDDFVVFEGNDSGRSNLHWKIGDSYLLFLQGVAGSHDYYVAPCGFSTPIEQAGGTLGAIHEIKLGPETGSISGKVVVNGSDLGLAGAKLTIQGRGVHTSVMSDRAGMFVHPVPPGKYVVTAGMDGEYIPADIFSYENPRKVTIPRGGCAQLQFSTK